VSIRLRIALAFLAAVAGMLGLVAWLVAQQRPVSESLHLVTEGYLPLSRQVALLKQDQARVQRDLTRLARGRPRPVSGETSVAEIYTQDLRDNIEILKVIAESMQRQTERVEEQAALGKAVAYVSSIDDLFKRYQQQSDEYIARVGGGADDSEALRRPLRTTEKLLGEEIEKLDITLSSRISLLVRGSEAQQARATAVATAVALGSAVGLSLLLGAVILALRPVARLTEQAGRIAAGDYGLRVGEAGDNEVGRLAAEFNAMAEAIEARDRSLQQRAAELDRLSDHLTSVLDSLDDGLIVLEGGLVTLANPAAVRQWAVSLGAPPPDELAEPLQRHGSHALTTPAGASFIVRVVPFGAQGTVAVLSDVTDEVRAQQRLARSERLAMVGQMLAQVTHEVRNPLNALSLNVELLEDEVAALDPDRKTEAHDVLALMGREVERLTAVTGHYLALARRPAPHPTRTELEPLLRDVARLLEPELRAADVQLSVRCDVAEAVEVDEGQLRQALLNVLQNAAQAGARRLSVAASVEGTELVITLDDDGVGMSDDERARVGEPFFTTKASGTGLGMAITRQIVEDHDGRVAWAPREGRGTRVEFRLPVQREPRAARPEEEEEG
jgi:signal transduction histidine kinase